MKARVTITRANQHESFTGEIIGETNSHYCVVVNPNHPDLGEWFAKESNCVNCYLINQ